MADKKYHAPLEVPAEVVTRYWCRNTEPVTSGLNYFAGKALQHVYAYRKKQQFSISFDLTDLGDSANLYHQGVSAPTSGSVEWCTFYCLTGYGTTHLAFETHIAPGRSGVDPWLSWSIEGGGETLSATVQATPTSTPTTTSTLAVEGAFSTGISRGRAAPSSGHLEVDPDQWTITWEDVPVLENTYYKCTLRVANDIRPICAFVYELGENLLTRGDPGVPNLDDEYRSPILDSHWEETVRAATALWKRNAAPVFVWSRETGADESPAVTGTTWTNIYDATTSVGAASVSLKYDLTNMASVRGDGIPCRLAVLAETESGGSGELRLQNSGGTIVSITGMDQLIPTWYVKDFLITTLSDTVDIQARNDTASTDTKIHAVCLLQVCMERTFPDRVDQWDNEFVGIQRRPQGLWPCNGDGTGSILGDVMGNQQMFEDGGGNVTYEVAVDDRTQVTAVDPHRSLGVQIDSGGYFEAGDASFLDASDDVSGAVRVYLPASLSGTNATILGKQASSTSKGYRVLALSSNGNVRLALYDGTTSFVAAVAEDFRGRWVDIIWAVDLTNDEGRIWVKGVIAGSTTVKGSDTVSLTGHAGFTNSETFKIGSLAGSETTDGQLYTWACAHDAYALTDSDRNIIRSPDFISQEGRILP